MADLYYIFSTIHLNQFAILTDTPAEHGQKCISNMVSFRFDPAQNQLSCHFGITVESIGKNPLLKAEIVCGFTLREDTVSALTKDTTIVFPVEMLGHIASLTYGTLRGLLYAKLENTLLQGLVLPLQNIYPYVTQPFVAQIDDEVVR